MSTTDQIITAGFEHFKPTPADIEINNHLPENLATILFKNVNIINSTGKDPYLGNVLIQGERIIWVGIIETSIAPSTLIVDGQGRKSLMSGLCDAHTHLSWTDSLTLDGIARIPLEEHVLYTARSAKMYLDHSFTMCFDAAAARPRLDISIKAPSKKNNPGSWNTSECPRNLYYGWRHWPVYNPICGRRRSDA